MNAYQFDEQAIKKDIVNATKYDSFTATIDMNEELRSQLEYFLSCVSISFVNDISTCYVSTEKEGKPTNPAIVVACGEMGAFDDIYLKAYTAGNIVDKFAGYILRDIQDEKASGGDHVQVYTDCAENVALFFESVASRIRAELK